MAKIQVLPRNMHDDSSLHFIPGVSNYDRGEYITLELYLTFKLLAGEDAVFQFEFSFTLTQSFLASIRNT